MDNGRQQQTQSCSQLTAGCTAPPRPRPRRAAALCSTLLLMVLLLQSLGVGVAQTMQNICTWDGKTCNMMINFAVQASRASQKTIDMLPKDPYIIGGQFIWGCSLNDYQGCLQDAKQGENSRNCIWDDRANLCIVDPMHTERLMLDKFLCNRTQIGQFLACSFMRTDSQCKFRKGCDVDDMTIPPTSSQVACVPDFWLKMPVFKRQAFMQQVNNFRSELYDDCPLARLAYQYRQSCFQAEDQLGCRASPICTWSREYNRCFPSDMAMSVLIWGGDRDDAQTGVTAINQCRAAMDKTGCTSVKAAVPRKPPPSTKVIRYDPVQSYTGNTNSNPNWGAQVYFPTFTGIPITMDPNGGSGSSAAGSGAATGSGAAGSNPAGSSTVSRAANINAGNMLADAAMPKGLGNTSGLSSQFGSFAYKNGASTAAAAATQWLTLAAAAIAVAVGAAVSMMQ